MNREKQKMLAHIGILKALNRKWMKRAEQSEARAGLMQALRDHHRAEAERLQGIINSLAPIQ